MNSTPFVRQLFVIVAPMLAALSLGGTIGYPNILLQQLQSNDSSIDLDLDTSSWLGSINGFASIPSVLMPSIMQWKGRKPAFFLSCLLVTTGWIVAYAAQSILTILISESLHGLGSQCVLIVSFSSLSELVSPKLRNISMAYFSVWQAVGIASTAIMGQYVHWKTVALIMITPIALGMIIAWWSWPESPSWLALQGRYKECETNFKWLRGDKTKANRELLELLQARKEVKEKENIFKSFVTRDFYIPVALTFLLVNSAYWSGFMVLIVYSPQMVQKTTNNQAYVHYSQIILYVLLVLGNISGAIILKTRSNKTVSLIGAAGVVLSSLFCAIITLLQSIGVLGDSVLCLVGLIFYIFIVVGLQGPPLLFIANEITAVKHRGIGGALYLIFESILNFSSLKLAPYMFEYIHLWGTFLVYCSNTAVCSLLIWKFVPETRNRTLQELEDYFNHGRFIKRRIEDVKITNSMISLSEL